MTPAQRSLRERLNLSRVALEYPRATLIAWALVMAAGVAAASRLPTALFPEIVFPVIVVTLDAPEQSAAAIEQDLVVPVERRLLALPGRDDVTATTTAGRAFLTVPFAVGVSLASAEGRVRSALSGFALPAGAALGIRPVDENEAPIATYALDPAVPAGAAGGAVEEFLGLVPRIAAIPGVARVVPFGVERPPTSAAAPSMPATRVRLNGRPSIALEVVKQAGANTLQVSRAVDAIVRPTGSSSARPLLVRAEAPFVREATGATLEALWVAVLLSILVIYPFLRSVAATTISGLAIPTSLLGTFLVMSLAGFKFETITLLALALVIGIIVDDAIVDIENIVRHLRAGEDVSRAVVRATDEIGLTVTAATLTIVAVFVPVALMGGVVGSFFRPFGLTIASAVLTSLLVARTLTPVLAIRWLRTDSAPSAPSERWDTFSGAYQRLLLWALRSPRTVIAAATLCFVGGVALVPLIPKGFIPVLDRGEFDVRFSLPPASGLEATDRVAAEIAAIARSDVDVERAFSVAGSVEGDAESGVVHIALNTARKASTQAVEARLRHRLAGRPPDRVAVSVENIPIIAVAAEQPLEIILCGADRAALSIAARRVLARIGTWPGVADGSIEGIGPDGGGSWMRHNGRPAAVIRGNLTGATALGSVDERVAAEVPGLLPRGISLELGGESDQANDVLAHFGTALGFAVLGVLAVLLLLFRSWQDPLAIAASLPLAAVGALVGLFLARSDFGIVSLLALVFLVGLVNKNAIILVDRINQLRSAGIDCDAAILEAGPARLRPILMTTAAAVLGMLPIAFGFGAGAELRAPMAVAIIGGLVTSTVLSLIVVPVIYRGLERLRPRFVR